MTVLYDARCEFCRQSRRISEALDWFHQMEWKPNPANEDTVVVLRGNERLTTWRAIKAIAIRSPLTWLLIFPAIALLPIFNPVGELAYKWIAANRHRLGSNSCSIE